MSDIVLKEPLVNVEWLHENLESSNLVVLDASLPKAGQGEESLSEDLIPGARFMDLKNKWAKKTARFPNTMLDTSDFEISARQLGISNSSALVIYDQHGIYSSARGWYMFRSMGHENVAVLDGGLPAWKKKGYTVIPKNTFSGAAGDFKAQFDPQYFVNHNQVLKVTEDGSTRILDARAHDRFLGAVEEPRAGLRSGHIPNSESMPFAELLENGSMRNKQVLEKYFKAGSDNDQKLVFSCGSGITACVLALGAHLSGRSGYSVYDGSWTEWGSLPELPVEKG
jgi:thiosulfate/3-mercaptopyruvate sulfurtransferase